MRRASMYQVRPGKVGAFSSPGPWMFIVFDRPSSQSSKLLSADVGYDSYV